MNNKLKRKAILRYSKDGKYLTVLCNIGHLLEYHKLDRNFGGSMLEAEIGFREDGDRFDRMAERCEGKGH